MEEALIKRILPNSPEAEQSVIGSMIMDREAILIASEILTGTISIRTSMELFSTRLWNCAMRESQSI